MIYLAAEENLERCSFIPIFIGISVRARLGSKFGRSPRSRSVPPGRAQREPQGYTGLANARTVDGYLPGCAAPIYVVNVNVNVISRTALIRNRVSRRVLHVSKITWGILYLFQEAQTH